MVCKKGKGLFVALLSALLIISQLGIFTPAAAYGQETGSKASVSSYEDNDGQAAEVKATRAASGSTVLTFTSDIHNGSNNTESNRLDGWLDHVRDQYGNIEVMSFCGDMGSASGNGNSWWGYVDSVMNVVSGKNLPGIYTTGNHEFYNGSFSSTTNATSKKYIVGDIGREGDNYIIYCLGTDNWDNNQDNYTTEQISLLTSFLNNAGTDKPIIVLTHYPLHSFSSGGSSGWGWGGGGRSTTNADKVIDALNEAGNDGKKIVLLWGHNHTVSDTNYDQVFEPGDTIEYKSGSSKTINFYYAAAGCMSDKEYGTGSESVKGKGLVMVIDDQDRLTMAYLDSNGNDVTEGGTFTEGDTIDATAISVSPKTLKIQAGESSKLMVSFTPAETTNKKVNWTSSDTSIATVSGGVVTGVAKGEATITAAYADNPGLTDTATITVTKTSGQGVTPEDGKKYVILAGDGYALTSEGDTVGYTNGSEGSQQYNYTGLAGEKYAVGDDVIPDRFLWTFTKLRAGDSYYIQSNDGRYLNGTYEANESGGYDGTLKLDDTPDVWVISNPASGSTISSSMLKSTNASQSDAGDKYLTHGNGSESADNIFSLRSEDNATGAAFYEYTDEGTYVADPDEPDDPPVVVTGTVYKEVTSFEAGKEYILAVTKDDGSVYAIKNSGSSVSSVTLDLTAASDGNPASITTDESAVVWTYDTNKYLKNGEDYFYPTSSNGIMTYTSGRAINYTDGKLSYETSSSGTYYVTCSNGTLDTDNDASNAATFRLFAKAEGSDTPDDPPAPSEENIYKLVDSFTGGKTYLIVDRNSDGSGHALTNPGGTSSGADMDSTNVTVHNGDVDGDGTADTYISTKAANLVWTAAANDAGFNITNDGDSLEGKSGNVKIFNTVQYADRYWTYTGNQLQHIGGQNTYTVYYSSGFTSTYNSSTNTIYIYELVDNGTIPDTPDDPPTPSEGTRYVLTDSLHDGGEYLITNDASVGGSSTRALKNPGGSSSGTSISSSNGKTTVEVLEGNYIETADTDIVWTATTNDMGFYLTNNGDYLEVYQRSLRVFNEAKQPARYWTYAEGDLTHIGGGSPYYLTYGSGTFSSGQESSGSMYLFEKVSDQPQPHTHTWDEGTVTAAATCEEDGLMTYTCTDCGETRTEVITAVGHTEEVIQGKAATCMETGLTDGRKCSVCGKILKEQEVIPRTEHVWDEGTVTKEATCTEPGEKTSTCTVCGTTDKVEIPASGHDWRYRKFSWSKDGDDYTAAAEYVCNNDDTHTETVIPEITKTLVEATCTDEGSVTFTATISKEDAPDGIAREKEREIILPALGHDAEILPGKAATCTETGITEGKKCRRCGETLTEQEVLPALGHEEVTLEAVDATCTETGLTEGKKCSRCEEILVAQEVTPAKGHEWTFRKFTWVNGEEVSATAEYVCQRDETHTISVTPEITKTSEDATCTVEGKVTYTATISKEDAPDGTPREYVKEIDGHTLDHSWNEGTVTSAATCTEDGVRTYTCNACGKTRTEVIKANGHTEEVIKGKAATETATGLTDGKKCSVCGKILVEQKEIPKLTPSKEESGSTVPTRIPTEISPSNPVSLASVDKQILTAKTDDDPKGSVFNLLQAKGVAKGKNSIVVSWKKVPGAKSYIVYGNKCGTKHQYKKLKTVKGTSFTQKKLKKGTYYKYLIVAVDGKKALATSKGIHVATKGGKSGNSKSVVTNAKKDKVSLKKGKTFKLKAKAVAQSKKLKVKKHRAIAYETSNKKIAIVSAKGTIKAVRKGTCYVYAYAQNGVCKKIKVTVK